MPGDSAAFVAARGLGFGLVCLTACSSQPSGAVHEVIVTPLESVIAYRDGAQLTAEARDEDGGILDGVQFTWSSSDTTIAQVSSTGLVFGRGEGVATIAARVRGVEGDARVVVEVPVASLALQPEADTLIERGTLQLVLTATGTNGKPIAPAEVSWSVSEPALASVGADGLLMALDDGEVVVSAEFRGASATAAVSIIPAVSSVEIWEVRSDEPGVRLSLIPLGATEGLRAIVRDDERRVLEGRAVAWTSSNPASLTVDQTGLVTAAGEGSADISATVEGLESSAVPLSVMIMPSLTRLDAGDAHTCAVAVGGGAYCWGNFPITFGETPSAGDAPVRLSGTQTWADVSVGAGHACGLTTGGAAYCWGANPAGQLGDGTTDWHAEPTPVSGGHVFRAISAGAGRTCGVTTAGEGYCWGGATLVPTLLPGGITFATISVSAVPQTPEVTCGVSDQGDGLCWGNNDFGQLGTGDSASSSAPQAVVGGHQWKEIDAGPNHVCGVTTSGAAFCWGNNDLGALGNGTNVSDPRPTAVSGGPYATISVGRVHTCAVRTSGEPVCFGSNDGFQLGVVGSGTSSVPVTPAPGLEFGAVRAATLHTCGLTVELVAYCWGGPGNGADAGAETGGFVSTPRKVVGQL